MQLLFIFALVFGIAVITFAVQNSAVVSVALGYWHFDASLAVVVLVAMALGALVGGLLSSPKMIAGQVDSARLRRRVAELQRANAKLEQRASDLNERVRPVAVAPAAANQRERPERLVSGGAH